ncbi:hypothetical protein OA264_02545 [Alphaproteobacteria bacterium]|nr:hypothetical protein [Alphaproteobacteria bacterium]
MKKLQKILIRIKNLFLNYLNENFSDSFINTLELIIIAFLGMIILYFIFVAFTEILLLLILLVLIMIYRKI